MTPTELLDVPVSDVLTAAPAGVRVFLDRGMKCVGCPFAPFETVAEVAVVYGIDPLTLACDLLQASAPVDTSGVQS